MSHFYLFFISMMGLGLPMPIEKLGSGSEEPTVTYSLDFTNPNNSMYLPAMGVLGV